MSLVCRTVINRTMKLLALALSVALLFTAGESPTDPPLNKHNLCCCATGTSAISCSLYCTGTADLSDTQTHSTLSLPPMWLHTFGNYLLNQILQIADRCMPYGSNLVKYTRGRKRITVFCLFISSSCFNVGEALNCHRCVPRVPGEACEFSVEVCKPGKDSCVAAKFLREPCEFLNMLKLQWNLRN